MHIKIGKGAKQTSLDQIMLDDKKQQQIILDYERMGWEVSFLPFLSLVLDRGDNFGPNRVTVVKKGENMIIHLQQFSVYTFNHSKHIQS